jgi:hypothetical protein
MKRSLWRVAVVALALSPLSANAAGLAPRSVQVGSSGQGVVTSYTVNATTATAASLGSVKFEFCDTATGACVTPAGVITTGATLTAQSPAGFTMINTTNGAPYIQNLTPGLVGAGTAMSYTLGNVTNPSTANLTYYVRITTYTGTDGSTGAVDTGTVALSTAQPVQLTGVTPEILTFCVGTSIGANCTTVSGSTIDFGDFSPTATRTGTSVMQAQTNAANGYVITVNGTTLASGTNTIAALGAQTASTIGTSQFGLNLSVAGTGSGAVNANFGNGTLYRFNDGDQVAQAALPTDANTFTSNYIVNIGGSQAAGVYTATMTYICTASF